MYRLSTTQTMSTSYPTSKTVLQASYSSPSATKSFDHLLSSPLPSTESLAARDPEATKQKTAYLSELRKSTKDLQEEINVFLTQKMGEDKAAASAADTKSKADAAKEAKEEEMYGEEEVEED